MGYGRCHARTRIGPMQLALLGIIVRLLIIAQFTNALRDAGSLRGNGVIDGDAGNGNTLFHRRVESSLVDEALDTFDQYKPISTSIAAGDQVRDFFPGDPIEKTELQKLIVGGSNAGVDENNDSVQPRPRIVNGSDSRETRFPWFVRTIANTGTGILTTCGGSLIAPDIVITAAHCGTATRVMINPYNLDEIYSGKPGGMVRRDVVDHRPFPDYRDDQEFTIDYDVMLLQLDEPILEINPISLNFDDNYPSEAGETLLMLGFGSIVGGPETGEPNGPMESSSILQEAPTDYVPFDECAVAEDPESGLRYGISPTKTIVQDFWLCTHRTDTSSCYGDSGGPIIKEGRNVENDLLLGVISGASGYCGQPYLPLWNNRVSYYENWIKDVGCELSTMPPAQWGCPEKPTNPPIDPPTDAPIDPPTDAPTNPPIDPPSIPPIDPPIESPVDSPVESPVDSPVNSPTDLDTNFPTSFPTNIPTDSQSSSDLIFYISIGVGIAGVLVMVCSIVAFILRRRKKRIDDVDQYSKDESEQSKPYFAKRKGIKVGNDPSTSSPSTSIESDVQESSGPKGSSQQETSVEYDLESQQDIAATKSTHSDRNEYIPRDSASMMVHFDNEEEEIAYDAASMLVLPDKEYVKPHSKNFVFPRNNQQATNGSPTQPSDNGINAVVTQRRNPPVRSNLLDRTQASHNANEQLDRVRPRSLSQGRSRATDFASKAKDNRPRSRSMERSGARDFPSDKNGYLRPQYDEFGKDTDTNIPRSRSKDSSEASNFATKDSNQSRSRSNDRSEASRYRETPSRSRGRSRPNDFMSGKNNSRSKSLQRYNDPPGERYSVQARSASFDRSRATTFSKNNSPGDRYVSPRSTSLDRSRATNYDKNEATGENYRSPRRSSSLDRSRAINFGTNHSASDRNRNPRRSSSLDRSRATNFANDDPPIRPSTPQQGQRMSPNNNFDSSPKNVSFPQNTPRATNDEPLIAPVYITKNPDGSIVHAVKRRRADGALVTTKTKYANIRLARKYGVPV